MKFQTRYLPLIALAILALLFALWAGLLRLGWAIPAFDNLAMAHGPLMVCGFLGVLIPLERAVAIRKLWMFAAPLASAAGWIALLLQPSLAVILLTLGSLGMLAILGYMVRREPHLHTTTMALGALAWLIGNLLWLSGKPIFQVVFWWITYLVLTIGGERLELSRVLRPTRNQALIFSGMVAVLLAGALLSVFDLALGSRLGGLALLLLGLWFLRYDLARVNTRHPNPLTRYIAICLFGGYVWLLVSGSLYVWQGALYAGPLYDAALHSVFVGFVMAMIFGHALIIFPAILGTQIRYYPVFYVHLSLLHLSLAVRLFGDLTNLHEWRQWGGLLNEVAILLFLALTIFSVVKGLKKQ